MVRIGIVGIGFMGMIHYLAAQKLRGARVTAICSRDPKKLAGDWRGIQGNFGPTGAMLDLSQIKRYDRLDEMLAECRRMGRRPRPATYFRMPMSKALFTNCEV